MAKAPVPVASTGAADTGTSTPAAPAATTSAEGGATTDEGADDPDDAPAGTIEARILLDQGDWRVNDVALLTASELKVGIAAGWADNHPDAIAYARSLAE